MGRAGTEINPKRIGSQFIDKALIVLGWHVNEQNIFGGGGADAGITERPI